MLYEGHEGLRSSEDHKLTEAGRLRPTLILSSLGGKHVIPLGAISHPTKRLHVSIEAGPVRCKQSSVWDSGKVAERKLTS